MKPTNPLDTCDMCSQTIRLPVYCVIPPSPYSGLYCHTCVAKLFDKKLVSTNDVAMMGISSGHTATVRPRTATLGDILFRSIFGYLPRYLLRHEDEFRHSIMEYAKKAGLEPQIVSLPELHGRMAEARAREVIGESWSSSCENPESTGGEAWNV